MFTQKRATPFLFTALVMAGLLLILNVVKANTPLDRIVAVVNNDIVLLSELDEQTDLSLAELRERGINPPAREVMQERVLDSIIMQKLQEERARDRGLRVSDDDINRQLIQIAQENNLTLVQLRDVLNREQPDGFNKIRQQIANQTLIQRLREIEVISQIAVTEEEINQFIQRRQLDVSNNEYRLAHILISRPDSATQAQRTELQVRINRIYQQLLDGASFAEMAITHSEGRQALNGGDLGWLADDQIPSFFAETVRNLQPGDISPIIESSNGFHIVTLLDTRRTQGQQGLALQEEAIQAIRNRKGNETFDLWMRRLRDDAVIDIRL
ncbi:peptidylprolyl isomerase [Thiomicrospira cyclica]|uniref:PpiC-type peptidyl-prolyl cis-trans isomerase n=1 Tax=Thiomicrospira cyclica (strain DSM 14477 / JCM 11371 / ALM1) TaxID=717773 RepID=F6D9A7_THICA|nr:peptidylprolyl isomerase [Thiomicrospira cyclica]AEG32034.1 PpiC-type peptidyl-prolyl cis-trans isomerase [Thiomicrospira cyclica ALM1]